MKRLMYDRNQLNIYSLFLGSKDAKQAGLWGIWFNFEFFSFFVPFLPNEDSLGLWRMVWSVLLQQRGASCQCISKVTFPKTLPDFSVLHVSHYNKCKLSMKFHMCFCISLTLELKLAPDLQSFARGVCLLLRSLSIPSTTQNGFC